MKLSPDEGKGEPSLGARKRPQLSSWTARKLMSSQPRPATAQPPAPAWEEAQRDDWVLQEFARTTTARPDTEAAVSKYPTIENGEAHAESHERVAVLESENMALREQLANARGFSTAGGPRGGARNAATQTDQPAIVVLNAAYLQRLRDRERALLAPDLAAALFGGPLASAARLQQSPEASAPLMGTTAFELDPAQGFAGDAATEKVGDSGDLSAEAVARAPSIAPGGRDGDGGRGGCGGGGGGGGDGGASTRYPHLPRYPSRPNRRAVSFPAELAQLTDAVDREVPPKGAPSTGASSAPFRQEDLGGAVVAAGKGASAAATAAADVAAEATTDTAKAMADDAEGVEATATEAATKVPEASAGDAFRPMTEAIGWSGDGIKVVIRDAFGFKRVPNDDAEPKAAQSYANEAFVRDLGVGRAAAALTATAEAAEAAAMEAQAAASVAPRQEDSVVPALSYGSTETAEEGDGSGEEADGEQPYAGSTSPPPLPMPLPMSVSRLSPPATSGRKKIAVGTVAYSQCLAEMAIELQSAVVDGPGLNSAQAGTLLTPWLDKLGPRPKLKNLVETEALPGFTWTNTEHGSVISINKPLPWGFVFDCNDATERECHSKLLFGLPRSNFSEMTQRDLSEAVLFLRNVSLVQLLSLNLSQRCTTITSAPLDRDRTGESPYCFGPILGSRSSFAQY